MFEKTSFFLLARRILKLKTNVEQLENSKVCLTIEVEKDAVDKALKKAYTDMKGKFNVPGFRKGKVPRHMIENMYGSQVFYDDAANNIINETLDNAIKNNSVEIVARLKYGDIQVVEMTPEKCIYKATITTKPKVALGEYKNLEIEAEKLDVSDEEIEAYIKQEAAKNAREIRVEGRAIMPEDIATIDFEGFIDGEAFENGSAKDHRLVIGSNSFIPGFEEQLIGKNIGEEVDVNISFPADYHVDELKGKPALFKVKINDVHFTELPEINDEFVADVSEFDNLEEYKADVRKILSEQKINARKNEVIAKVLEQVIANATFELPVEMVNEEIERLVEQFSQNMKRQGVDLEKYLEYTGIDHEMFRENFKQQATTQLSNTLVLEEIAKTEDFEISDEDLEKELENRANQYHIPLDQFKKRINENYMDALKADLKIQKAIDLLVESSTIVDIAEEIAEEI
ncbi:MAG: trigger factor [Candidatus Epulonipiscioides saccharophilum]|nr:MAG: trigger factor [Epulopiscium sp. AS2M-Bin001]